jgi:hypothetical protein
MTREDVIRIARDACDKDKVDAWQNDFWTITQKELERFAYLVAKQERERIAQKIEQLPFGDTAASFGVYVREA